MAFPGSVSHGLQYRSLVCALGHGMRAAGMKTAAGRRVNRAWEFTDKSLTMAARDTGWQRDGNG